MSDELREALTDLISLCERKIYPQPDKPNSDWMRVQAAKAALAQPQNDVQWNKKLADDLERLCCAETEGKFFDLVTDSIQTIVTALRQSAQTQNDAEAVDARRYRRLRILGCAPMDTEHLKNGFVMRFTNLDKFVDDDLRNQPSRGEATRSNTAPPSPERMREALEYIVSQQWDENADLDDICQTAEEALSKSESRS